ncbi:MAG TPA: Vms1/Ankzf1 family peptidyl-tRNA hydrolase [Pyrinomonadaceae bacterium]|jgi:stalled ribosome rescue protein Dom34|nr:Vms1/Ankzf1 family peptidyl-tRNA hydrolase [Pyrinomonadaceae bacterium]
MKTPDIEVDDRTAVPKEATTPQQLMDSLLKFDAVSAPVVSLYLDARVNEHGKRVFLPFVRKQLSERLKTYPVDSEERASIEEDFVRIMRYLEDGVRGPTQGVAVFACSALDDYFQVGQFEAPFERNRLVVSERPHVYPLARLIDQYRHYAVVLADTNRAQIFVFAAGRVVQQDDIQNVKTKHTSVGGWSQARYQRHEENYHLQHAKEVVDALERTLRDDRIEHVILAGDEAVVIPILKEQMSKELQEKVVDTISLGIDTPEHEVLEETLTAFRRHDSLTDMQKVEQLLGEFRGDNLAVAGVPDTLAALSNGQVEELLIVAAADGLKFDEEEVRKVLDIYKADDIPETLDARAVADELVRRANQMSAARVTFIEDTTRLEQLGGVGALLRYRISEEKAAPYETKIRVIGV